MFLFSHYNDERSLDYYGKLLQVGNKVVVLASYMQFACQIRIKKKEDLERYENNLKDMGEDN